MKKREAGVLDPGAREAAEEVASFENRLANLEARLLALTWMVATVIAMLLVGFGAGITLLLRVIDLVKH
jgi:hypothetical protein